MGYDKGKTHREDDWMIEGQERRVQMIKILKEASKPISGSVLGRNFGISRQVVVQDIALLRAEGFDVLATARGYILNQDNEVMCSRIVVVKHDREQLEDELNTIVDNGGRVRNVIIQHPVYGDLVGDLMLKNRRDVKTFVKKVNETSSSPLLELTDGMHMHTIEAMSYEDLDVIEEELKVKGYIQLD